MTVLLRLRNRLAIPNRPYGHDPTHIMGRDLFPGSNNGVSVVATKGQYKQASIYNSPVAPTNTTTPAFSYDGRVGWIGSYPSGTAYPTWGLANTGFNAGVTFACMGIANATSSGVPYAIVMNGTPGASGANWPTLAITAVGGASSGLLMLITSTTYTYGGFPFTNGRPYFWAVSHLVGTSKVNLVQRDLITGQAWSLAATAFTSGSGPMTTPSGNINILGNANGGWGNNGAMLAAAAYVGGYHTLPELLRWADAPWDFWYPPTVRETIYFNIASSHQAYSLSAATGSYALTGEAAALARTHAYSLAAVQGAYSQTGEAATLSHVAAHAYTLSAVQGSYALAGHAVRDPIRLSLAAVHGSYPLAGEAAALALTVSPVRTLAASSGIHAVSGSTVTLVKSGFSAGLSVSPLYYLLTGGTATMTVTLAVNVSKAQPPYLRETTYRARQLGYSFDPSFTVVKDRPGPIRIVEFDGWM